MKYDTTLLLHITMNLLFAIDYGSYHRVTNMILTILEVKKIWFGHLWSHGCLKNMDFKYTGCAKKPGGTGLADGRGSATRFSESYPLSNYRQLPSYPLL